MKKAFIACGLLKPDLDILLDEIKPDLEIIWLESKLHSVPEKLKNEIQAAVDSLEGYDQILLSYALCGNALIGLTATTADVIYLKTDDCISVIMCEHPCLGELRRRSIFTNRSWLASSTMGSDDIAQAYQKYGEERAKEIIDMMYVHYKNTVYMQTEEEVESEASSAAQKLAERTTTELIYEPASLNAYRALLKGEDHELIHTLKKGESLKFNDFYS